MSFNSEDKLEMINKFGKQSGDTGSPEVQIAIMTGRINNLTRHFQDYKHDNNSKRGLMRLVGRRKRLLRYLHSVDVERYRSLIAELGIRGSF